MSNPVQQTTGHIYGVSLVFRAPADASNEARIISTAMVAWALDKEAALAKCMSAAQSDPRLSDLSLLQSGAAEVPDEMVKNYASQRGWRGWWRK